MEKKNETASEMLKEEGEEIQPRYGKIEIIDGSKERGYRESWKE